MIRFASFLAPNVFPAYQFIVDYIGRQIGCPVELVVGDSHDQFAALHPDVAFICGLPYVLWMRQGTPPLELLAAPVLQGERYGGRPIYYSDVIVRYDSPFKAFTDLRGCSWAYNEQVSQSGYGITRHRLLDIGATTGYFRKVVNAGWHQRAMQMVAVGEIDAAAIDSQVLGVAMRDHPALANQLKMIEALGPSTIQPVVVNPALPTAMKRAIRAALLAMGDDPQARPGLSLGLFERFVPITDSDYDDIRAMLTAAEAAGFMVINEC